MGGRAMQDFHRKFSVKESPEEQMKTTFKIVDQHGDVHDTVIGREKANAAAALLQAMEDKKWGKHTTNKLAGR